MLSPTQFFIASIVALVLLGSAGEVFLTAKGSAPSDSFSYLWLICFALSVTWWVESDRKTKGISVPFEYQAFVFFLWPIVLPYYLYQTRGFKGVGLGVSVFLFSCIPTVAAFVTYSIVGEPW